MTDPVFTVIMATWNRGQYILPSVQSVLRQDMADFELLVIGDACTDDTEQVIASIKDPRLRWINLDTRWRTQSGPNNRGNEEARGQFIAYIGHDDIWAPNHLSEVLRTFRDTSADLVTSGVLLHPASDSGTPHLMGFGKPQDLAQQFTPPSGLAHRRSVWSETGGWHRRENARGAVDIDFELRAAEAGHTFHSTGVVTVHKFTASARYLSYLLPSSDEQEAMLHRVQTSHQSWLTALTERASRSITNLVQNSTEAVRQRGVAMNDIARGLQTAELRALGSGVVIPQDAGRRTGHWLKHQLLDGKIRYSVEGVNPNLLVPVSGTGAARLDLDLYILRWRWPRGFRMQLNGQDLAVRLRWIPRFGANLWRASAIITLRPDAPSVLTLFPPRHLARDGKGLGAGAIRLTPL